ncbi:hypothetical protein PQR39_35510 [Paraburkholderia sediminicola]|uniref:hypothetical protein n=1 Tax=Paraburkholderia sediminicola TaxID=458836 RepID=UPI0038BC58D8
MHAKQQWWYVYDRDGRFVHTCKCFTESGAIADAVSVTARDATQLTAQTTFRANVKAA